MGNTPPCAGKKSCSAADEIGEGTPCECGGKQYYDSCKKDDCTSDGINENGGYCYVNTAPLTAYYYYIKDKCTTASGTTYKVYGICGQEGKNCNGETHPCSGMTVCKNGTGIGEACECGGQKFYRECADDDCNNQDIIENGGRCYVSTAAFSSNMYYIKDKCTTKGGVTYKAYGYCTGNVTNCDGSKAPCPEGYKICGSGYTGSGNSCACGDKIFYETCVTECNYEKTETDCTAGHTFTKKCYGNDSNGNQIWFGECK